MSQARILSDTVINGHSVKCNQVVEADDALLKGLAEGGIVDSDPAAIKYALEGHPDVVDCTKPPEEAAAGDVATNETTTDTQNVATSQTSVDDTASGKKGK